MKAAEIKALYPSEAALCDRFLSDLAAAGGWTAYPETGGFDILAVYDKTGHQLGIEAKLALNAKVAAQILPHPHAGFVGRGPDFRAVIVPAITEASFGIARMLRMLGVQVWAPTDSGRGPSFDRALNPNGSRPEFASYCFDSDTENPMPIWGDTVWFDWNPIERCELPDIVPTVRAGVPAPLMLTPWKIGALRVLALIEVQGYVTAKDVRELGVEPRRFCASDGWLKPVGGGRWVRGTVPTFDLQHPEAFATLLTAARQKHGEVAA